MAADTGPDSVEETHQSCRSSRTRPATAQPGRPVTKIGNPFRATTCQACSGILLNAANARSPAGVTGPAMSQSMNPAKCPARHTAL
jgi:hypothetical protein